jgi:hypothetical protein
MVIFWTLLMILLGMFFTGVIWAVLEPPFTYWLENCWLSRKMEEQLDKQRKEIARMRGEYERMVRELEDK